MLMLASFVNRFLVHSVPFIDESFRFKACFFLEPLLGFLRFPPFYVFFALIFSYFVNRFRFVRFPCFYAFFFDSCFFYNRF
jgi:hypothetical protein